MINSHIQSVSQRTSIYEASRPSPHSYQPITTSSQCQGQDQDNPRAPAAGTGMQGVG